MATIEACKSFQKHGPLLEQRDARGELLSAEQLVYRVSTGQPKWFGWKGYVVPCNQLAPVLDQVRVRKAHAAHYIDHAPRNGKGTKDENGWLTQLSNDTAGLLHVTPEAVYRRLYDVLNGKARIVHADMAAAMLETVSIDLDRDTEIPTLPGTKMDAFDLVRVRAEDGGWLGDDRELVQYVPTVLNLAAAIIERPEMTSQLQDDAPFNCLRAWSKL